MKAGWEEKPIGEILQLNYGKPLDEVDRKLQGLYPVYGANGEKDRSDRFYFDKPSIIVGRKGSAGEVNLTEPKFWPLDVTYFVTYDERKHDLRFLYYLLTTLELPSLAKGVKPGINRNEVYSQAAMIPPLPVQQRIVGILDKAFDGIDTAKLNTEGSLQRARQLFQSILSATVIGELTRDWRANRNSEAKSAELDLKGLLKRIQGVDRKPSRKSEETVGHESVKRAMPKEWELASVEMLFNIIDYRGKNPQKAKEGRRLITAKNIKMGYLSDEPVTFISEKTYKNWMVRGYPKPGDILFVTEGHTMGFAALNTRTDNFGLAQRTITLQPIAPISTEYFFYFILSKHFQDLVRLNATGAAAVGMKGSKFRSLPLPFPSFTEQETIVGILDSIKEETQRLESIYKQKLVALDALKKSLLHQAFTGQL